MTRRITKAIFPVAGQGTRFLPATKSIPKEILPLIDKPLIQYAIDEARAAGIEDMIFVTARGKSALEDYFDTSPELERSLRARGKAELLAAVEAANMPSGAIAYVRQNDPLGLGHAVLCAQRLIGDEPFAVILPDDVIAAEKPCLAQMVEAHAALGGSMIATMDVASDEISAYGAIAPASAPTGRTVRVQSLVEKPAPEDAPSNLAVIGRYILAPTIFDHLAAGTRGAGGEIQLTDAIDKEAAEGTVHGYRFDGRRFDCGAKLGFLEATVAFALERPDLGDAFRGALRALLAEENVGIAAE